MELRILLIALRVLDPRKWRMRLLQLAGGSALLGWFWFKSVNDAEIVAALREQKHVERNARIRAAMRQREADYGIGDAPR